jgi:EAL and modified HD-GYP domain-containing signal transduction protein
MSNFVSSLRLPRETTSLYPLAGRNGDRFLGIDPASNTNTQRYFVLQPIHDLSRTVVGYEALYRSGWTNEFDGDSNVATRTMIDNWLLFGFETLTSGHPTCLNCTREALVSGLLTLLPRSAVLEILEFVEPDDEVLKACRALKKMGCRFSLDDFVASDKMEGFLELADFIKVDFRLTSAKERAKLMPRLKRTGATLIAEKIETEEEFRLAAWEGFHLFQGFYFHERTSFVMTRDSLNEINCLRILETLSRTGFATSKLADLIDSEPGIACRLLRRANWTAGLESPINSIRDALKLVGRREFRKLMTLAMFSDIERWNDLPQRLARCGAAGAQKKPSASEPTPQ